LKKLLFQDISLFFSLFMLKERRKPKEAVYSWNRSLSRRVQFKPGKKIGLVLGEHSTITRVRSNSQAYWKGIQVGYVILKVNGLVCEEITIKPMLQAAVKSGKPFAILFKVPAPSAKTEYVDEASPKVGSSKDSSTIEKFNDHKNSLDENKCSKASSSIAQMKLTQENETTANVNTNKISVTENGEKETNCNVLQNSINMLKLANLELQKKYSAEVLKLQNDCMKKDAKIVQLERQINIVRNERNALRKQMNRKTTEDNEKSKMRARESLDLGPIAEVESRISLPDMGKRNLTEPISVASTETADVVYHDPNKDMMQGIWKGAKREANLRSLSSCGTAIGVPFGDSKPYMDFAKTRTSYTESYWSTPTQTPRTEYTQDGTLTDLASVAGYNSRKHTPRSEPSVILMEGHKK